MYIIGNYNKDQLEQMLSSAYFQHKTKEYRIYNSGKKKYVEINYKPGIYVLNENLVPVLYKRNIESALNFLLKYNLWFWTGFKITNLVKGKQVIPLMKIAEGLIPIKRKLVMAIMHIDPVIQNFLNKENIYEEKSSDLRIALINQPGSIIPSGWGKKISQYEILKAKGAVRKITKLEFILSKIKVECPVCSNINTKDIDGVCPCENCGALLR